MKKQVILEIQYHIKREWEPEFSTEVIGSSIIVRENGFRIGRIDERYNVRANTPELKERLVAVVEKYRLHVKPQSIEDPLMELTRLLKPVQGWIRKHGDLTTKICVEMNHTDVQGKC